MRKDTEATPHWLLRITSQNQVFVFFQGQLVAGRERHFTQFITGPRFPHCLPWERIAHGCIMLNALTITFS